MSEPVAGKAKILFTAWINRADGTREYITGESEVVDEQACIGAGIPKQEKVDNGTDT